MDADDLEHAFAHGVNYFYWGAVRTSPFGEGLIRLARAHRDKMVITLQTFTREVPRVRESIESALRKLPGVEYADFLMLGAWDEPPPEAIMDAARGAVRDGLARGLMLSSHRNAVFPRVAATGDMDGLMVRYNAAHPEADDEVFPKLGVRRPGVVCFTATRWGDLMNPAFMPESEATPRASDCYRFAMSSPGIDVTVCGPRDRAQLDEALASVERGPMHDDELAWMRRVGKVVAVKGRQQAPAVM
jgi:aryl-alcohol dehydrogenase-like predicted oxidoreductase